MKSRTRNFGKSYHTQDFWPSFTDVMSNVAMLLFFLMLLAYIQSILTGRQLAFQEAELEKTRVFLSQLNAELDVSKIELGASKAELDASRLELESASVDLNQLKQRLEDARWTLMGMEDEIEQKEEALKILEAEREQAQAEIQEGRKRLEQSKLEIEAQQGVIASSNEELGSLRVKLSDIAVLRVSVLEKVSKSIETEIGKYTDSGEERVAIGPNANIVINETLLFDYASAVVKDEAKQLLDQLAIAFERLLDDPETREYIDYVSIEGHTDSAGSAGYNRSLSAERAVSVVNYMMESNPALEAKYAPYFGTGGFSKFRPLELGDDAESRAKNRRIEISIVVKDENIRGMIEDFLGDAPQ